MRYIFFFNVKFDSVVVDDIVVFGIFDDLFYLFGYLVYFVVGFMDSDRVFRVSRREFGSRGIYFDGNESVFVDDSIEDGIVLFDDVFVLFFFNFEDFCFDVSDFFG